ncbi:MAG: GPW/gp25 family protein [Planctomycetota bacterium]
MPVFPGEPRPTSTLRDRLVRLEGDVSNPSDVNSSPKNGPNRAASSGLRYQLAEPGAGNAEPARAFRFGERLNRRSQIRQLAELHRDIEGDLVVLLGTKSMSADHDLSNWPRVEKSVLNFGAPDLTGATVSSLDTRRLQKDLVRVIRLYEPRLHAKTLEVRCSLLPATQNRIQVVVEGSFGPKDAPEAFAMRLSICLVSGQCNPLDHRRAE